MTGPALVAYVEKVHVPTLKRDGIVVLDNLPAHKIAAVGRRNQSGRRAALPATTLLARHEPHRTGLRQAQDTASPRAKANRRRALAPHRPTPRLLHSNRMPELFHRRRLRRLNLRTLQYDTISTSE
jgi:hypothetical protein